MNQRDDVPATAVTNGPAEAPAPDLRIGSQKRRRCQVIRVKPGGWTKAKRQAFLDSLVQTCNVTMATAAAGMQCKSAYDLRNADPVFAGLWQQALVLGYERLETALLRHALIGVNALEIGGEPAEPPPPADGCTTVESIDPPMPPVRRGHAIPGSGIVSDALTPIQVQVALAMLNRRDAAERRGSVPRGLRKVTLAEAEAALTQRLEALARQKAHSAPAPRRTGGGDAS